MSNFFVTKKIAAGYMIERVNPREWLTPEGTWDQSIFEGAAFKKRQDAERVLTDIEKCIKKQKGKDHA